MSETEGQRNYSPLVSERGVTTISDTVVTSLAGMAAQEVDGVHMGGGASRTAGGVLGSITGSESRSSGISVEVGRTEVAIDLKMGIEYNKNILQTVDEVRRRITDRVESTTGLRIKELNATITDITFPEKEARRRLGPARPPSEPDESPEATPATAPESPEDEQGEPPERETTRAEATEAETAEAETAEAEITGVPAEGSGVPSEEEAIVPDEDSRVAGEETVVEEHAPEEVEPTEVEPTSRAHTEAESGSVPEEEVSVEGRPLEEDETAEVRMEEETAEVRIEEEQTDEVLVAEDTREAPAENETTPETSPEPETPEARMRRRAEERARRRRRRTQDS